MSSAADLWEINPHLALWQSESYVSPSERAWERWVKKVEKLVGHSIDGDQDRDGFSLDYACDCECAGMSPEEYALEIAAEKAARVAAPMI